ncbi:MAG TPA: SRPBCC domain-containing protein [Candidatus Saccharimonadales bacterium]|nr:SRPBCC domain-containing protein [Candidatus Saccharimonadales bacterium]
MGKATVTAPQDQSIITIERIFAVPKDKLYKAISTRELIAQWWTGPGYDVRVEEFDPQEGGKWRYVQSKDGEEFAFYGVIHEFGPERVVQTFEFSGLPERGHVIMEKMELTALDDNTTKLQVTQAFFSTQERDGMLQSGMEEGMNNTYDVLESVAKDL